MWLEEEFKSDYHSFKVEICIHPPSHTANQPARQCVCSMTRSDSASVWTMDDVICCQDDITDMRWLSAEIKVSKITDKPTFTVFSTI